MDKITHTITGVRDVRAPGSPEPVWMIDMASDDGTARAAGFPHSTLAWRAAEYGIDPSDFDTLLDVVLHEPHMQHTVHDPTFLYNTDQDTARAAHLERVKQVRRGVVHLDPDGHLNRIQEAYDPQDPAVHTFRRRVESIRQTMAEEASGG